MKIPILQEKSDSIINKPLRPRYFYKRYQDPDMFEIGSSTATFVKIPGLSVAVHHTVPMIYKIRVQISSQLEKTAAHSLIRFLINDQVLISDQLLPNNDNRLKSGTVWDTNIIALDFRGGSLFYSGGGATWLVVPYFKSELVLMPAGTHLIEVGARTEDPLLRIWGGELLVEVTEYDPDLYVGLAYPNVRRFD
ncbi:unnamed protein product [Rotaria sp. Silwood1]|nr:unnamed protein product [Rotaria sp. Silwood1]